MVGVSIIVFVIVLLQLALYTSVYFFFFNDTATTEIYTLSLHDALPISVKPAWEKRTRHLLTVAGRQQVRSEEHTSELQSRGHLVCRLLLEKKNNQNHGPTPLRQAVSRLEGTAPPTYR